MKMGDFRPFAAADFTKRSVNLVRMILLSLLKKPCPSQGRSRADSKMLSTAFRRGGKTPALKATPAT
jgi:hypothetical protein